MYESRNTTDVSLMSDLPQSSETNVPTGGYEMGTPCFFNSCCPKAVADITVNTQYTTIRLSEGEASIRLFSAPSFSGTELELPETPLYGFDPTVYVNGLLQGAGTHYAINGTTVTFHNTLHNDDVQVFYGVGTTTAEATPVAVFRYSTLVTGTSMTLPAIPGSGFPLVVFVNGVLQTAPGDYSVSGAVVTFTTTLASDSVQVWYSLE